MTVYQPGQRITLVHTADPYTDLRPGATGTVRRHDQHLHTVDVDVDWDSGSRLSMCLDAGDSIQPLAQASTGSPNAAMRAPAWAATLARLADLGTEAGRGVAEWWAQDTIGGRATGNVRATARRVLAGIEDGDPAVLDTLPTFTPPIRWHDGRDTAQVRYTEAAHDAAEGQAPHWRDLTDEQRAETIAASREAFDTAVVERVAELCHLAASPTGADVSYLHPDHVRIGRVGVFAGDWARAVDADGADRVAVGFVGTLVDTWNGWAVFTCTREVAEAIVADQQRCRRDERRRLAAGGVPEADLDTRVDQSLANVVFDGDTVIVDERAIFDDPDAVTRIIPDEAGEYQVMGYAWCWEPVDPACCETIAGTIPTPGQAQRFVELVHTPQLRLPHQRLVVTGVERLATHNGAAFTATLALDGQVVGTIEDNGNGGEIMLYSPNDLFGWQGMRVFLDGCRLGGTQPSQKRVLDALVEEFELDRDVTAAQAVGDTYVRLVTDDGVTGELRRVSPRPVGAAALRELATDLASEPTPPWARTWVIWSGGRWRPVAPAAGPAANADDGLRP
mgnify:CR=1 FL=1